MWNVSSFLIFFTNSVKIQNTQKRPCLFITAHKKYYISAFKSFNFYLLLIFITTDGPHQLLTESSDVFIKIGETHHLTCEAKSEPSPVFTWLINGYETFENIASRDYTSNLQVHIKSVEDLQTYTCLASNIHGQSKQTFVLKEKVELEDSPSKTSSKTAGVILYTLALIICTFIIY